MSTSPEHGPAGAEPGTPGLEHGPAGAEPGTPGLEPGPAGAERNPVAAGPTSGVRLSAPEIARLADAGARRRAPRYGRFIGVGVLVGAVLAAAVALLGPRGDVLGPDAVFLLLFLAFGGAGGLLGGLAAVIADRRAG